MAVRIPNTIENLRIACTKRDWDGYDSDPI